MTDENKVEVSVSLPQESWETVLGAFYLTYSTLIGEDSEIDMIIERLKKVCKGPFLDG